MSFTLVLCLILQRGCQPLHNAAYNGQAETVRLLMANSADISAENKVNASSY